MGRHGREAPWFADAVKATQTAADAAPEAGSDAAAAAQSVTIGPIEADDAALVALRQAMLAELASRYPELPAESDEELLEGIRFLAARRAGALVGCCALQANAESGLDGLELKRMYLDPAARGSGAADALVAAVEELARELGAKRIYLETGVRQPEARRVYERNGFEQIDKYPPYTDAVFSVCYAKTLL